MGKEKKRKITFESNITCPHCDKEITVKKVKTLVTEAVPAEYDEELIVEKNLQKDLDEYEK